MQDRLGRVARKLDHADDLVIAGGLGRIFPQVVGKRSKQRLVQIVIFRAGEEGQGNYPGVLGLLFQAA